MAAVTSGFEAAAESLRSENAQVKKYAERLERELGALQMRFPEATQHLQDMRDGLLQIPADNELEGGAGLPPWLTSPQLMPPLLKAYDARIAELEGSSKGFSSQVQSLQSMVNNVVDENEMLHQELSDALQERVRRADAGEEVSASARGGIIGEQLSLITAETINELQEQLNVALKENEVLAEQVSLYESNLETTRGQLSERDAQLVAVSNNFDAAASALKQLKSSSDAVRVERDALQSELDGASKREADASVRLDRLQAEYNDAVTSTHKLEEQLRDHRKALTEVTEKANRENEVLEKQAIAIAKRSKEIKGILAVKEGELETLRAQHASMKVEHDATRKDCEGMLKVMEGMERQIAEYATREEETVNLAKEAHDKVEKALVERDQALAREVQSRREVARSIERRKEYMRDGGQREKVAAERARAEMQLIVDDHQKQINDLSNALAAVEHQRDRAKKDLEDSRAAMRDTKAGLSVTISELQIKTKALQEQTNEAEKSLYKARVDCNAATESAESKVATAEKERTLYEEKFRALEKKYSETFHASESREMSMRQLRVEKERCEQELAHVRKELSDVRLNVKNEATAEVKRFSEENSRLSAQVRTLELTVDDLEAEVSSQKAAVDRQKKVATERVAATSHRLEALLQEHKDECSQLRLRNKEVLSRLETMQRSWNVIDTERTDALSRVRSLQSAVAVNEEKISESRSNLAEVLLSEEQRLDQIAGLKEQVSSLERRLGQAEKERDVALADLRDGDAPAENDPAGFGSSAGGPAAAYSTSSELQDRLDRKVRKLRRRIERRRRKRAAIKE